MLFGAVGHLVEAFLPHHVDRNVDQIANNRFHVAAHIAHFGEFARLYLEKRGIGEFGKAPGDLGLADTGGPNHQDVLGHHFFGHFGLELLAADPVAERNSYRPFGVRLADYVLIQFGDDLARGEFVEQRRFVGRLLGQIDHHLAEFLIGEFSFV